jgi:hypothetical protein
MNESKKVIFLREGKESKMFTMWKSFHIDGYGMKEEYLKNLSTDRDKAENLAMAYAEKFGFVYVDDAQDSLNTIARGEDVIRFGKHKDCRLSEVSEKYLLWIAQGCPIKELDTDRYSNTYGEMITVNKYFGGEDFQEIAQREAVNKGIGTIQDGEFYSVEYWNVILKKREARSLEKASEVWEHHYAEKTKVQLNLTFVKETSYDTCYGRTYIITFKENATGRMFLYKGANYPNAKISYKYKYIEVAEGEVAKDSAESWKSIVKGATYQVKGTVKLGDYKGIKQTFLQRLTISKDLGLLEYSDMQELNNKIESAQAL